MINWSLKSIGAGKKLYSAEKVIDLPKIGSEASQNVIK